MKTKAFVLLLFVALLPLTAFGAGQDAEIGLQIGRQAPDFTLELRGGEGVTLSELRGKPVVLNFWATWCANCLVEMPDFQAVYEEYGDRVHMLGVSVWEPSADVDRFLAGSGSAYTYPIAYDFNDAMANTYELAGIPMTWILNGEGVIVEFIYGKTDAETLRQVLDQAILAEGTVGE